MGLIDLVIVLVVIGVVLFLLQRIPMDATIRTIITVLVIICVCVWIMKLFGITDIPVRKIGR